MSGTAFRRARAADLPALLALLADGALPLAPALADVDDPARYRAAFDAIDRDPNQLLVVGEAGGEIVATMQLTFIPGLTYGGGLRGQIEAVRVRADRRGNGIGRDMVAWGLDRLRARGVVLVQLTSNRTRLDAHRFWQSLGFEPSHLGFKRTLD